jgi:thermitase
MRKFLSQLPTAQASSGWLWGGILVLLLAACGSIDALPPLDSDAAAVSPYASIATVDVDDSVTRDDIEAAYGADVIVWRPEGGFAIIAYRDVDVSTLGGRGGGAAVRPTLPAPANRTANRNVVSVPQPQGADAQGVFAWAGGISAWAGGVSAWAGGVSAWAGGVDNPFPGNDNVWNQIKLGQAQESTTGRGAGITIAVIDTGIDLNHVAFANRLAPSSTWRDLVDGDLHPHEGFVTTCIRWRGKNCVETGLVRSDDGAFFGHGTAVAGVALQAAPNARILPIPVLRSSGEGSASNVAVAIDHAIRMGANVINLSLGTLEPIAAIDQMVAYANSLGIVVVAAAGNANSSSAMYPAATAARSDYPLSISVGSVDAGDRRSWFSNYGSGVEMMAPGEGVATLYPGDALAYAVGTSFSTPWVAGVVALALGDGAARPSTPPKVVDSSLNINNLNPGFGGLLGKGRLDSLNAVKQALGL